MDHPKNYNDPFDSIAIEDDIINGQWIKLLADCFGDEPIVQELQDVFSEDMIK